MLLHAASEDCDQTGWMPRLVRVLAGSSGNFIGFVMQWLMFFVYAELFLHNIHTPYLLKLV